MSLREEMLKQRGSSIYCVENYHGHSSLAMVRFCPWREKEWLLRWAGLDSLDLARDEDGRERLEMHFAHHHVTVIGFCLHLMQEDIQTFKLCCMRSYPASYRTTFPARETFIEQLLVQPKSALAIWPPAK